MDVERRALARFPALERLDRHLASAMARWSAPLLRFSLAVVFLWFGALKVAGVSPVADLVAATVPQIPPGLLVPALGVVEIAVGLGLLTGFALRLTLALFWAQLAGTFLVLLLLPQVAFDGHPLLLSVEGEFVVKNLVLIAAGIAVGGSLARRRPDHGGPSPLRPRD